MKKRIDHTKLIPEQKNIAPLDADQELQEAIAKTQALQNALIGVQLLQKMGSIKDDKAALEILQPYVEQCEGDAALLQAKYELLKAPRQLVKYPVWIRVLVKIKQILRTKR